MEYIVDNDKSLLTIRFNNEVLKHIKAKVDDYLNVFQSNYNANFFTVFKADTGYRIIRVPKKRKLYQIIVRHKINYITEFENKECLYYKKKNGFLKIILK